MENNIFMLKENIKKLMENHKPKVTQTQIGKITGATQPQISKYFSDTDNSFFRVDQLIAIADYFEVSIDELAGRDFNSSRKRTSTMRDIIAALFELEKVDFDINERHEPGLNANPLTGEPYNTTIITHDISFSLNYLDSFLEEWKEARSIALKNEKPIYKQMYESWKKDKLNAAENESLNRYSIGHTRTFMDIPDEIDEIPFD